MVVLIQYDLPNGIVILIILEAYIVLVSSANIWAFQTIMYTRCWIIGDSGVPFVQFVLHFFMGKCLKEYYEIVNEARPLSWLQKCISNHETKQASKFRRDLSSNCFTIDVWKIKCCMQRFISFHSYCYFYLILHIVLECFDMWYFGNRFVLCNIYLRQ